MVEDRVVVDVLPPEVGVLLFDVAELFVCFAELVPVLPPTRSLVCSAVEAFVDSSEDGSDDDSAPADVAVVGADVVRIGFSEVVSSAEPPELATARILNSTARRTAKPLLNIFLIII